MKKTLSLLLILILILCGTSFSFAGAYASHTLTSSGASSSSNPNGTAFFATSDLVGSTFTFTVTHANNEWRTISNVSSSAGYFTVSPVSNCYIDNGQLLWTDKSPGLLASFTVEVISYSGSASLSVSDSCSAWDYYLGLPAPAVTGSYSLPCGNTIYLDLGLGSSYDLSFDCTFRETAGALNNTFADTFYYAFANTIPETTSSFTPSVGTYITMYKDMDSANIFGYTKVGHGAITGTTTGQYLVIVNPLYYAQTTNVYNTNLKISGIPVNTTVYTYPVSSSISGDEVMSTITSPSGGTGTVSASGGAITTVSTDDPDLSYTPIVGGNTVAGADHNYVEDVTQSISDTLSDFTSDFTGLLSAPISHIRSLIDSGSNLFQHLSSMWSWLPSEVVATISSALSIVVVVAIFKVFL